MASTSPAKNGPKKVAKPPPSHPPTIQMVKDALEAISEPKGVPASAIKNYICEKYKDINPNSLKPRLRQALTKGLEKGIIVQTKATLEKPVLMSRFKLVKEKTKKVKKTTEETVKKTTKVKTSTEKKTTTKKATEKVKATKSPKKTATKEKKETKPKKAKSPAKTKTTKAAKPVKAVS
ncbi:unnamed protein product [Mytilus edulis]|uniref:H15 domain-containing protein n=1 Tax=Mytilus edulis TaxID=6550 RepID=A0A8S3Q763_MYTED|nr:unnamed protein product [Mytilus edulis]